MQITQSSELAISKAIHLKLQPNSKELKVPSSYQKLQRLIFEAGLLPSSLSPLSLPFLLLLAVFSG